MTIPSRFTIAALTTIWATLLVAHEARAQLSLPPAGGASTAPTLEPHLRFDRLTGMAKGAVSAIVQDANGFIWFGTEEGLSRYDGYDFVSYGPGVNDQNTLSNFTVTALASSKDALWIGTVKGLDKLDLTSNTFTHFHAGPTSLGSEDISSLSIGGSGLVWIGTSDAGVDSLDPATGAVKHYRAKLITDDSITVVLEGGDKKVWIGTRDQGLNLLDPATGKVTRFTHDADKPGTLSNDQVTSLFQDATGTVWVGTGDGLNALEAGQTTFKHYLGDPDDPKWITTIIEGADTGLWLGVKGVGVFRLDRKSGAIERYIHDGADATSITHPWPRCAFSDHGGVLWFGFQAGGVSKLLLVRREFAYYRTTPGMSFLEDGDQVWLGTQGQGLRLLNLKTGAVKTYLEEELSPTWAMKIVAGDKGSLWIGTLGHGLLHFTPRTGELSKYDAEGGGLASDAVPALYRDKDMLWIGTFGAGLAKLDTRTNTITYYKSDPNNAGSLSSDNVVAIHQDVKNPGLLWVGTTAGLNAVDTGSGKVVRYLHDPKRSNTLSHDHVNDIHEDASGQLWIVTWGGGLDRMDRDTGTFQSFHMTDGLASEVLYGILEDKKGALWITGDDGLTEFDPKSRQAITYRVGDGLQDDEFGQGGFYQGASGRFYVGGPRGFNVFTPDKIKPDTYVPPVAITKFEVLGESKPIPQRVKLTYRDRWFSVSFSALGYASPLRNRYKYRLKGFDNWVETDRRFVSYSSLPPGNYTLEIVGSNSHGVWAEHGVSLPIHVPPPPWRTWWAFSLYGLLLLLVIGLFVRRQRGQLDALRRVHRLSELEREMALTSAVQEGFFPPERSVHDGSFRLEAFYRPAAECGGDWWTYEARGDSYFVIVGDATGHGAGSAMVTAAAAASFRSLGRRIQDDERLTTMNEEVLRVSREQYHMTLTAVDLNLVTGHYTVYSCGGVPVFALAPGQRPRVLMCPGTPLGSQLFEIGKLEGQLATGERLLILTDGIPEVSLANEQLLGPRGVANFYQQTREQELESALSQLIKKVEEVQATSQDDDWTVVLVQWGTSLNVERSELVTTTHDRS